MMPHLKNVLVTTGQELATPSKLAHESITLSMVFDRLLEFDSFLIKATIKSSLLEIIEYGNISQIALKAVGGC